MTKYKINPFVTVDGLACKTPIAFKRLTDRKMKQKGPDFSNKRVLISLLLSLSIKICRLIKNMAPNHVFETVILDSNDGRSFGNA